MTCILCKINAYIPTFCGTRRIRREERTIHDEDFEGVPVAEEALSQLRESLMAAQRQAEELFMDEKEADPS